MSLQHGDGTISHTPVMSEKMFNQILVHPDDQVFHRFVWRDKPTDEPTIYQWLRLRFGDKPAPDIAPNSIKLLAKTAKQEQPQQQPNCSSSQIDDIAGSRPTVQQVKEVTTGIDSILEKAKFEIKTWHSNSKEIDQSDSDTITDLLGHKWNKETDKLTFKRGEISELCKQLTKRKCLSHSRGLACVCLLCCASVEWAVFL